MTDRRNPDRRKSDAGDSGDSDTFLLRWARRKARAERQSSSADEADAERIHEFREESGAASGDVGRGRQSAVEAGEAAPEADAQAEAVEVEAEKGDEDMPSLDTIDQGGSVADFFSSRVSPALRKAALRRLFRQSTLPVGDDLDDYADDYTKFTKLGDIVTSDMRHRMEVVRQRLLERNPDAGQAESRADDAPAPVVAAGSEPQAADGEASRKGDEKVARADAGHRSDCCEDQNSTEQSSEHDPDPR